MIATNKVKENLNKIAASAGVGAPDAPKDSDTVTARPGGWLHSALKKININIGGTPVIGTPPSNNNVNFFGIGIVVIIILLLTNNKR